MASLQNLLLLTDSSLLAYYNFENNSNDYKGNHNGTDTSMSYIDGKYNKSASFSGTCYINNTGIPTLTNFTISFWIKPSNGAGAPLSIRQYNHIYYTYDGSSSLTFKLYNGSFEIALSMPVVDDSYQHIVVTRSGSTVNCYVNNVLSTTGTSSGMLSNAGAGDYIGCFDPGIASGAYNSIFTGEIDDLCIFSRALISSEISQLYEDTISTAQTLGEYRNCNNYTKLLINFNNGSTVDYSGRVSGLTANNLTYEYDKSRYKKCAKFNGTSSYITYSGSTLNDFTFSTYAKMNTGLTGDNYLLGKSNDTNNSNIDIYVKNTGLIYCTYYNGINYAYTSTISIADNKWHNVIVTRSGSTLSVYVDGKLDGSKKSVPTTAIGNYHNQIGRHFSGVSYMNGWMDEIIVETEAWSPIRIKKYFTNSLGRYAII